MVDPVISDRSKGGGAGIGVALWLECSLMVRWVVGLILHGGPSYQWQI